jgi:hypothetical protein
VNTNDGNQELPSLSNPVVATNEAIATIDAMQMESRKILASFLDSVAKVHTQHLNEFFAQIKLPEIRFLDDDTLKLLTQPVLPTFDSSFFEELEQLRIQGVTRFVKSSELTNWQQDRLLERYHLLYSRQKTVLSDSMVRGRRARGATRFTRKRRRVSDVVHPYWDTTDGETVERRLSCIETLALTKLPLATAFFGAYDALEGISNETIRNALVEAGVSKDYYIDVKTGKLKQAHAAVWFHSLSDPNFGESTANRLGEFHIKLNELHKSNVVVDDSTLAEYLQQMEMFITDIFSYWCLWDQMESFYAKLKKKEGF